MTKTVSKAAHRLMYDPALNDIMKGVAILYFMGIVR